MTFSIYPNSAFNEEKEYTESGVAEQNTCKIWHFAEL